jgi:hypothetical protein
MVHICECGMATSDLAFLRSHLAQSGHRERVPWWSLFSQVLLVKQLLSASLPVRASVRLPGHG